MIKILTTIQLIYFIVIMGTTNASPEPEPEQRPGSGLSNEECVRRIYRRCNHRTTFSAEELENVRQFFNYSFTVLADIKPDKPLCPKLRVRQDWNCLTPQQRNRVINVWKQMYRNGDIQRLTDIHVKIWPAWHKAMEFLPGHRWITNVFEDMMRAIDPSVTLPYWDIFLNGVQPERASLWDTLGHSGNYSNGYSVPDGIYPQLGLLPTVKRHWSPRGTIYPFFTQEVTTSNIQLNLNYPAFLSYLAAQHFPPHLGIGGYEGQYSVREAPYDVVFFLHHTGNLQNDESRWQLLQKENLTPLSYNQQDSFNVTSGVLKQANIYTDTITGSNGVRVKEMFWLGFGDNCFVSDQMIPQINNLMRGIRDPIPTAAKRMPRWIQEKYFPYFLAGNYTGLAHTFTEIGECNTICRPIPKATYMRETEQGRRQFEAFIYDSGFDQGATIDYYERYWYQMWEDLNRSGYCSPYVTTY